MAQTKDQKGSATKPDDLTKISKHSVELTESGLVNRIRDIITESKLTQSEVAERANPTSRDC